MEMKMSEVKFDVGKEDHKHLNSILNRAHGMGYVKRGSASMLSARMDIAACHANGCPLDFAKFAAFDDFNFAHDFLGIMQHINRETGKLDGCFLPRCAKGK